MKTTQRQSFIRGAIYSYLAPRIVEPSSVAWSRLPTDIGHLEQGVRRAAHNKLAQDETLSDLPSFLVELQALLENLQPDDENNMNSNGNGDDQEMDPTEGSVEPSDLCDLIATSMAGFNGEQKAEFVAGLRNLLHIGAAADQPALRPGAPVVTTTVPVKAKDGRRPAAMDSSGFNQRWGSQLRGVKVGSGMLRPA